MKRTMFFIVLVTLALMTFGQHYQQRINETIERHLLNKSLKTLDYEANDVGKSHFPFAKKTFPKNSLMKSQNAFKQRLDSIISKESMKQLYYYDANSNMMQETDYDWDKATKKWVERSKFDYTYDANGNLMQQIYYQWYNTANQWVERAEYDASGHMTLEILGSNKYEHTYDAKGNLTLNIIYEWDHTANQWKANFNYKQECTYDANGNITQGKDYIWDETSNQFLLNGKSEYTYDSNGNQTQYISYVFDSTANQWVVTAQFDKTFDANGNLTQEIDYKKDNFFVKNEYTYDANGNRTLWIIYDTGGTANQWVGWLKGEYTYDANGNVTQLIFYHWDNTVNRWVEYSNHKNGYTYDNNYTLNELLLPPDLNNAVLFKYKLLSTQEYEFNESSNEWNEVAESDYYYSDFAFTAINHHDSEKAVLYPNPASECINLIIPDNKSASFELLDMQGRIVKLRRINNVEAISMDDVKSGTYLYNLYFDGKQQSGKLIKK